MFVLCLARRELLEKRSSWGGPTSTGFLVELDPLAEDVVEALLVELADRPLETEIRERIVANAGGNPLFAEQLLAYAVEAPDAALAELPGTLEALLASRLDRLEQTELEVLRSAAVIGRRFSPDELEELTAGLDARRPLQQLADRGLVHAVDDLCRFHHVLVRDVAYRGIPKSDRAALHERAARGLDRRLGADELVGYHFEQAYTYLVELTRDDARARELALAGGERLGRAGIRAWKRADAPAAVNLLSRAVALLPDALEFACELGVALRMRGELDRALDVLGEAQTAARDAGDVRLEQRALLERTHIRSLLDPNAITELLDVATEAVAVFESNGDDRSLGRAWFLVGHVKGGYYCDNEAWSEASAKAADHYRRAGWSPAICVGALASALFYGPTPVDEAIARCEALLEAHADDRASEANVLVWLGPLEAMRGRFEGARRRLSRARVRYEELGQAQGAITCGFASGVIEMLAGRPDAAELALRESCAACERLRETEQLANRAAELADTLYVQGKDDEAETWARISRENSSRDDLAAQAAWRGATAKLRARAGAVGEAEALAREEIALMASTDLLNDRARALLDLAAVLRAAARNDEAEVEIQQAIELLDRKGNVVAAKRARALSGAVAAG